VGLYFEKLKSYLKKEQFSIGRDLLLSIVLTTLVSSALTFYVNRALDTRVSSRQLIYDFSRTFFDNPKYRAMSTAIEESYLYGKGAVLKTNGGKFTDYDLDDYLYFLDDLYTYGEEGLVSYNLIYRQFAYYVCLTYNHKEVQAYSQKLRDEGFSTELSNGFLENFARKLGVTDKTNCRTLD